VIHDTTKHSKADSNAKRLARLKDVRSIEMALQAITDPITIEDAYKLLRNQQYGHTRAIELLNKWRDKTTTPQLAYMDKDGTMDHVCYHDIDLPSQSRKGRKRT
jgi:hypothetical protein